MSRRGGNQAQRAAPGNGQMKRLNTPATPPKNRINEVEPLRIAAPISDVRFPPAQSNQKAARSPAITHRMMSSALMVGSGPTYLMGQILPQRTKCEILCFHARIKAVRRTCCQAQAQRVTTTIGTGLFLPRLSFSLAASPRKGRSEFASHVSQARLVLCGRARRHGKRQTQSADLVSWLVE